VKPFLSAVGMALASMSLYFSHCSYAFLVTSHCQKIDACIQIKNRNLTGRDRAHTTGIEGRKT